MRKCYYNKDEWMHPYRIPTLSKSLLEQHQLKLERTYNKHGEYYVEIDDHPFFLRPCRVFKLCQLVHLMVSLDDQY